MPRPPTTPTPDGEHPPDTDFDSLVGDSVALAAEPDSVELAPFASLAEQLNPKSLPRLEPGTILGDSFEIEEVLGTGGMGIVYRARDLKLGRRVALKLHRPMARGTERLMREAASMAQLTHPNVATVHEVGTHEGMLFIAMEFIDGVTARRWVAEVERTPLQIVALYLAAGQGLAAAHDAGIVHRDFKPENVLVGRDDVPRVVDFGLARSIIEPLQGTTSGPSAPLDHPGTGTGTGPVTRTGTETGTESVTQTGSVLGTPAYMAPEQFEGREVDALADQFSFCVSLYEAVFGKRPFAGTSSHQLLLAMARGQLRTAPTKTRVTARLSRILMRGLEIDPQQRWPSMKALLAELVRLLAPRSRRWVLPGLMLGALGLGGGLVLGQRSESTERCDAEQKLANIWDDGRRMDAKAALLGTELSYAPDTWARVESRLDDYAHAWGNKYTEVCESSTEDAQAEQDRQLRLDCLRSRSRTLRATVDQLARADAAVVERAVTLTTELPSFDRCDDLDALRAVVPPPEDPQVRRKVEALRDRLADVRAKEKAGKYRSAFEALEPVVGEAEALGYGPLIAEAKARRGVLHSRLDRFEDAERDLRAAYEISIEYRHDEIAFQAARVLTEVIGLQLARYAEGQAWGGVARAHARRSGDETHIAIGLQLEGRLLGEQGEYEQAESYYRRSLEIEQRVLGPDHPDLFYGLHRMGGVLWRRGRYEEALRYYERALQLREQTLGPEHPDVAGTLGNLANVRLNQGELQHAAELHERARTIWEKALGPDHLDVGLSLGNLGNVRRLQGRYEEAQRLYERALLIMEAKLGPDHPNVAASLDNLGIVLLAQGEYEQSERYHVRAVELRQEVLGPDHPQLAHSLHNLGTTLVTQGKYAQAQVHLERAVQIVEKGLGPDHPQLAATVGMLGRVHAEQGALDDARRYFKRALQITQDAKGSDHPDVARALSLLATAAFNQEDFDAARAYTERAVSIRKANASPPALLAKSQFMLARLLWTDPTQRARARTLGEQARDALLGAEVADPDKLAAIEQWLATHDAP